MSLESGSKSEPKPKPKAKVEIPELPPAPTDEERAALELKEQQKNEAFKDFDFGAFIEDEVLPKFEGDTAYVYDLETQDKEVAQTFIAGVQNKLNQNTGNTIHVSLISDANGFSMKVEKLSTEPTPEEIKNARRNEIIEEIKRNWEAKNGSMHRQLTRKEIADAKSWAEVNGGEWDGRTTVFTEEANEFFYDYRGRGKDSVPDQADRILLERFPEYAVEAQEESLEEIQEVEKEEKESGPKKHRSFEMLPMTAEEIESALPSQIFGEWTNGAEFKKLYRKAVQTYHPDKYETSLPQNEKAVVDKAFQAFQESYEKILNIMEDQKIYSSREVDDWYMPANTPSQSESTTKERASIVEDNDKESIYREVGPRKVGSITRYKDGRLSFRNPQSGKQVYVEYDFDYATGEKKMIFSEEETEITLPNGTKVGLSEAGVNWDGVEWDLDVAALFIGEENVIFLEMGVRKVENVMYNESSDHLYFTNPQTGMPVTVEYNAVTKKFKLREVSTRKKLHNGKMGEYSESETATAKNWNEIELDLKGVGIMLAGPAFNRFLKEKGLDGNRKSDNGPMPGSRSEVKGQQAERKGIDFNKVIDFLGSIFNY